MPGLEAHVAFACVMSQCKALKMNEKFLMSFLQKRQYSWPDVTLHDNRHSVRSRKLAFAFYPVCVLVPTTGDAAKEALQGCNKLLFLQAIHLLAIFFQLIHWHLTD